MLRIASIAFAALSVITGVGFVLNALHNPVDANRAYQVGMVNKVVARDQLMLEAEKVARRICELSPVAVQGMKELMVRGSTQDYHAIDQLTDWV